MKAHSEENMGAAGRFRLFTKTTFFIMMYVVPRRYAFSPGG